METLRYMCATYATSQANKILPIIPVPSVQENVCMEIRQKKKEAEYTNTETKLRNISKKIVKGIKYLHGEEVIGITV